MLYCIRHLLRFLYDCNKLVLLLLLFYLFFIPSVLKIQQLLKHAEKDNELIIIIVIIGTVQVKAKALPRCDEASTALASTSKTNRSTVTGKASTESAPYCHRESTNVR